MPLGYLRLDASWLPTETWVVPLIGLLAAGLTLVAGRVFLRRRLVVPPPSAPAPIAPAPVADIDPFLQGGSGERRLAARRKGNHVEVLVTDADAVTEPVRGWVIDRSLGGLCVELARPVRVGEVLSLKPRQAPPGTPWVRVEVRSCNSSRGYFEVGVQFQRTPPWAVLLLFG